MGETFGNAGVARDGDRDRLIDRLQRARRITLEPIGFGEVGKNAGLVFEPRLARSCEAERASRAVVYNGSGILK